MGIFYNNSTNKTLISDEDTAYNLNNFTSGKTNVLLITGLSGSGKSTLAKQYTKKYNGVYIELDNFNYFERSQSNMDKSDDELSESELLLKDYLGTLPSNEFKYARLNCDKCDKKTYLKVFKNYFEYILEYAENHPRKKFIIEGIQIFELFDKSQIKKMSIIIKQTGLLKSLLRKLKRDEITIKDLTNLGFSLPLINWYIKDDKLLNKFEKYINESENNFGVPLVKDTDIPGVITIDSGGDEDADDSPAKTNTAKAWMKNNHSTVIIPCGNLKELNKLMDQYNTLTGAQKDVSDAFSLQLYGVNNTDHYEQLYTQYVANEDKDYTDIEQSDKSNIYVATENTLVETCKAMKTNISTNKEINKLKLEQIDPNKIFDCMNNLPCFTPEEMIEKGVFENSNNFYGIKSDNYLVSTQLKTRDWFNEYILKSNGILTEQDNEVTFSWVDKLNELYSDFEEIKESGDINKINSRKQSILELGWNPELSFNLKTRQKVNEYMKEKLKIGKTSIIDMTKLESSLSDDDFSAISETVDTTKDGKFPIYLVLVYTASNFGKVVTRYTKSIYSHAAISLDSGLENLYSFNMTNTNGFLKGGFSTESISNYVVENKDAKLAVYSVFVNKKQYYNISNKIKYYIEHVKETGYSVLNLLGILIGKPIHRANDMICSQFADVILKAANVDITDKDSSLVTPNDLYMKANEKKLYKLYEGPAKDYSKKNSSINKVIKSIDTGKKAVNEGVYINSEKEYINILSENINDINTLIGLSEGSNYLSESNRVLFNTYIEPYLEFQLLTEAKEFPIQFDKEGNLLISKMRNTDFNKEYAQSHKLLMIYQKNNNIEGIKYEVAKLWFLNLLLEDIIYNKKKSHISLVEAHKSRARILNDFNKYIKIIAGNEKDYNFSTYYNNTPFSDATIKVNNSTLKYSGNILKSISKLFL